MKLSKFKIRGFRSYRDEVEIKFEDLTVFVGRNDIGKSTILEALDIFFNEGSGAVKPDKNDINVQAAAEGEASFTLTGCFSDLPETIIIDETAETSLRDEYMLNGDGMLEIVKTVKPGSSKANIQTSVRAIHPVNAECADLLQKKQKELQKIIKDNGIPCGNLNVNSVMRKAIWEHYSDSLELAEVLIDTSKGDDTKEIWGKLSSLCPLESELWLSWDPISMIPVLSQERLAGSLSSTLLSHSFLDSLSSLPALRSTSRLTADLHCFLSHFQMYFPR